MKKTPLKQIVGNDAVIESKGHTAAITHKKTSAWDASCSEFNENENVTTRAVQRLQVRHMSIMIAVYKSKMLYTLFFAV